MGTREDSLNWRINRWKPSKCRDGWESSAKWRRWMSRVASMARRVDLGRASNVVNGVMQSGACFLIKGKMPLMPYKTAELLIFLSFKLPSSVEGSLGLEERMTKGQGDNNKKRVLISATRPLPNLFDATTTTVLEDCYSPILLILLQILTWSPARIQSIVWYIGQRGGE